MEQKKYIQLPLIDDQSDIKKEYLVENFSANEFYPSTERRALEKKYAPLLEITNKFNRQSVSYQLSKKDILHSWLKYKEGFSADLVNLLLDEMNLEPGDTIMDPFFGSGTTGLVCKMRGLNSIGFDIMPISAIAIKAKSSALEYKLDELKNMLDCIKKIEVPVDYKKKTSYIKITQDAYPEKNAIFLKYISEWLTSSSFSKDAKNLLTLCIVNSLEVCSYTVKSGQYLGWDYRAPKVINANKKRLEKGQKLLPRKVVRKHIRDIQTVIAEELLHVIDDIKIIQESSDQKADAKITYIQNSVLLELPKMAPNTINGVITSPPYCNRYDYTRTYALELVYLGIDDNGIKKMRQDLLSCTVESKSKLEKLKKYYEKIGCIDRFNEIKNTIHNNNVLKEVMEALYARKENGDLNNNGVIRMVEGYFTELAFIYAELYRICTKGSKVVFVNDNVRYGGEVIPVDFLSSLFAEQFGFKIEKIYCLKQKKGNSSQQMAKYGKVPLRKSLTIWVKE